ncbi:hypothetical protein PR048_004857 [Dryococelus australis]|uniref:Uncharacterized protein n=1 Tax=Dryococelus australis TaxID=614101 RepID=A0ABQ9I6K8_9NEOP|nr:hypothetical protein PR048_004857 [Dryococelus australis]
MYVKSTAINNQARRLHQRFENCKRVTGIRNFHRFMPVNESTIRCYITLNADNFENFQVSKHIPLNVDINYTVACIYDRQWWLAVVNDISTENKDVHQDPVHHSRKLLRIPPEYRLIEFLGNLHQENLQNLLDVHTTFLTFCVMKFLCC